MASQYMMEQVLSVGSEAFKRKSETVDDVRLSVIIPAFDEASVLRKNLDLIERAVTHFTHSYEIIIAEDGCSETAKIATELANDDSKIIHLHSDHRLGKGLALKMALKASKGKSLVFMDADLSTSLHDLFTVVDRVENGCDVVIGSRYIHGASVSRSLLRNLASVTYNILVKFLFRDDVSDHQCGFKGFKGLAIKDIIHEVVQKGFFFDTELLVRMKRKGFKISEIPVKWMEPEARVSKFNLLSDGIRMGLKLLSLRLNLWVYK